MPYRTAARNEQAEADAAELAALERSSRIRRLRAAVAVSTLAATGVVLVLVLPLFAPPRPERMRCTKVNVVYESEPGAPYKPPGSRMVCERAP